MSHYLPYIMIDDDFYLNYSLLVLILYRQGLSTKKNATLDFEKLQIFLYLTKNPSKINPILNLAGKKFAPISAQYTYTIESLSTNVDMLFDRAKLKSLLKELASRGMLSCDKTDPSSIKYLLSEPGTLFAQRLIESATIHQDSIKPEPRYLSTQSYFPAALEVIDSLSALQSQSNSKLNSFLNTTFKRT
ncbi:ABC-three component system middle component 4 [Pseudomonas chlororaphis]|uniref:ABC-three component system middle component 4 n=1 Tax=Pseudomonas chlororaphis TaxID=587753 RepID=UPI0024082835|nr:ABC-three component system middle component 4 [Pseudomonas chlororaphis]